LETRFCKIDAEKSPFLCDKLKIFMLPTLALICNSKVGRCESITMFYGTQAPVS
jgi:hypothetical protein